MSDVAYPFDQTGIASSNLVSDEVHTLTEINAAPYRIIIPEFAPFYLDNLALNHIDLQGNATPLIEGVDYVPCLRYIGATISIGKMLYGGLSINNNNIQGLITVTYQTLGGEWLADASYVKERLASMIYNPRMTVWDIVTNKPNQFPPIEHDIQTDFVYDSGDLLNAINRIVDTLANNQGSGALVQHKLDNNNPHEVTKAQVGLADVVNYGVASDTEIQEKASLDKYVTLRQLVGIGIIDPTIAGNIATLIDNVNHLNLTSDEQAGLIDAQTSELITIAQEVQAQSDYINGQLAQQLSSIESAVTQIQENPVDPQLAANVASLTSQVEQLTQAVATVQATPSSINYAELYFLACGR